MSQSEDPIEVLKAQGPVARVAAVEVEAELARLREENEAYRRGELTVFPGENPELAKLREDWTREHIRANKGEAELAKLREALEEIVNDPWTNPRSLQVARNALKETT